MKIVYDLILNNCACGIKTSKRIGQFESIEDMAKYRKENTLLSRYYWYEYEIKKIDGLNETAKVFLSSITSIVYGLICIWCLHYIGLSKTSTFLILIFPITAVSVYIGQVWYWITNK
jgi:hypothetical protein